MMKCSGICGLGGNGSGDVTEARVEPKLITLGRRFREFKEAPGLSKLDLSCASEV